MKISLNGNEVFARGFADHLKIIAELQAQQPILEKIAAEMTDAILNGNKILWCGNGGSAADSQHLSAELVGRFKRERGGLPSIALTTDTSVLTAIANDYGYDEIFRRQVEALCNRGDVVVGISTSGSSRNVVAALKEARDRGAFTIGLTGAGGGAIAGIADAVICVPASDTARVQEGHILCGHMLCDWIETAYTLETGARELVAKDKAR
jgi:D-sedoheptulose 7-phosphate isomerase